MLRFLVWFALATSLLVIGSQALANQERQPRLDVTGTYRSNWDDVRLTQDGDHVRGTYVCCGGGTIEGRIIEGRTLRYVWRQPSGWGRGVWTLSPGRLSGTWGANQDDASGGRWDLTSARSAQLAQ